VNASRWLPVPILLLLVGGCGSSGSGQSGSAFTFLTINSLSPGLVQSSIADVDDTTQVCVTVGNNLKNPTLTAPNSLDNITIQSYTVKLRGADGRQIGPTRTYGAGVVVPAGTVAQGTTAVSGNTATFAAILVPPDLKRDPALRPPTRFPFTGSAEVVFKGRDGRGSSVEVDATVAVVFVAAGEDSTANCTTNGGA
jgi:hypothetical protein